MSFVLFDKSSKFNLFNYQNSKNIPIFLFCLILISIILFSCNKKDNESNILVSPEKIHVGEYITISYNPSSNVRIDSIKVIADVITDLGSQIIIENTIRRENGKYKTSFLLDIPEAKIVVFNILPRQLGTKKEINYILVFGKDEKPVINAYYYLGIRYLAGNPSEGILPDFDKAEKAMECEKELYPDNWYADELRWRIMFRSNNSEEIKTKIRKELHDLLEKYKEDKEIVSQLLLSYVNVADVDEIDSIYSSIVKNDPYGVFAETYRIRLKKMDFDEDIAGLIESYFLEFPKMSGNEKQQLMLTKIRYRLHKKQFETALNDFAGLPEKNADDYILMGDNFYSAEYDNKITIKMFETAKKLLQSGINERKTVNITESEHLERIKQKLSHTCYMLGKMYINIKKFSLAESEFEEAFNTKPFSELNKDYAEMLFKERDYQKTISVCERSISQNLGFDGIIELYEESYKRSNKRTEGFFSSFEEVNQKAEEAIRAISMFSMMTGKVKNVSGKTVDGKTEELKDYKGKLVIIDHSMFNNPDYQKEHKYLQALADFYKNDQEILIILFCLRDDNMGDKDFEEMKRFYNSTAHDYKVLSIPYQDMRRYYNAKSYILDKEGNLVYTIESNNTIGKINEVKAKVKILKMMDGK
jgi:tetratricopeptide (TPR) repeat protein